MSSLRSKANSVGSTGTGCNHIYYAGCIDAEAHSRCYGLCEGAPPIQREQFLFCSDLQPACEVDCYDTLTVTTCQASCDELKGADCITSSEHARCFHGCRQAPVSVREQFTHCAHNSQCLAGLRSTDYCDIAFSEY